MALGKPGDIVSYNSPRDGNNVHYGVVIRQPDGTHNIIARNLGIKAGQIITWEAEENVTACTVQSGTDSHCK
jgi:hypothetical protein